MIRGSISRLPHRRGVAIGFMRDDCRISGVWAAVYKRCWYVGVTQRRGPCRHQRRAEELRRKIDRTVAYFDELAAGPLPNDTVRMVVDAARAGLLRPAPREHVGGVTR